MTPPAVSLIEIIAFSLPPRLRNICVATLLLSCAQSAASTSGCLFTFSKRSIYPCTLPNGDYEELHDPDSQDLLTGRSQVEHLSLEFRFAEKEVCIRRKPATSDVILPRRPESWDGLFPLDATVDVPEDFMSEVDRNQGAVHHLAVESGSC